LKLSLISLATVKAQLGLTDDTHDSAITALIPVVSSDIRRILNNNFTGFFFTSYKSGENSFIPTYGNNWVGGRDRGYYGRLYGPDRVIDFPTLEPGQVLQGEGIPDDAYIESYDGSNERFTLSVAATEDGHRLFPTVNISQWPTISQMIWYRINNSLQKTAGEKQVKSKNYGPVSITYADSEINRKYNYPQALINQLGTPNASLR